MSNVKYQAWVGTGFLTEIQHALAKPMTFTFILGPILNTDISESTLVFSEVTAQFTFLMV